MRLGVNTPVVMALPGSVADWELQAGIEEITQVAQLADRLGYTHLTCSEHVGVPRGVPSPMLGGRRGTTYWDPLATLSYLAGQTQRIRLATNVLVLGYHHPLAIAKRFGTLDRISGGRLVLGLGVGSLSEEFALLGASFPDRGARADEALRALRAALSQQEPSFDGEYYSFSGFVVAPHAVQPTVPMWVGGNSVRALRRASALADGWVPAGLDVAALTRMLDTNPVPPGFEVVLNCERHFDAIDRPSQTEDEIAALAAVGVTILTVKVAHRSLGHYLEQLEALAGLSCFERSH